jgi:hypothetical protein
MFGSIGSLLVLVSAVGGGITVARARVPRIDPTSRVLSGTAGILLVAVSMAAAMLASMLHPQHDPAGRTWPTSVSDGPEQDGVDVGPGGDPNAVAVAALHRRQSFRMRSDAELLAYTLLACDLMGAGRNGVDVVGELRGNDITAEDARYLVTVAVGTVCPGSGAPVLRP